MPITTEWLDDRHEVIIRYFASRWTWDEFNDGLTVINDLANSVPHDVVLFMDMRETHTIPPGNVVTIGRALINQLPNSVPQIICVTQSQLIEVFADLVLKVIPNWRNRIKFVRKIEEAEQLIATAVKENMTAR